MAGEPPTPGGTGPSDAAFSTDQFQATLAAAFPDARVTDVTDLGGESPNLVAAVTLEGGTRYALKCAPESGTPSDLAKEAAVIDYVARETDVSVAPVVAVDRDPDDALPYLVTAWAAGGDLQATLQSTPRPLQTRLFDRLGATLATLHAQTGFDAPGEIVATGPRSFEVDTGDSWAELFARRLADRVESLGGTRFEPLAEDVWDDVSERLRALETGAAPVLLHGDIGDGNVTYDGTDVDRVLDWERAFVGQPEYDLCRAEVRYFWSQWGGSDPLQSALYSGYRSVRDLPEGFDRRRRLYLATFYLRSLSTYEAWGPGLTDDLDGFADSLSAKIREVMRE
jgi:aminoglycoside phosphotransferase (APT) family kinase protein